MSESHSELRENKRVGATFTVELSRPGQTLRVETTNVSAGGAFLIGAQNADANFPNFDRAVQRLEAPMHRITLAPFFMARHELTQGQWQRLTYGEMPSTFKPGHLVAGITSVVSENGALLGVISDGDLRRQLGRNDRLLSSTAKDCMSTSPITVAPNQAATAALALMEEKKITSLMVPDDRGRIVGVVHLHDLWRLGDYF